MKKNLIYIGLASLFFTFTSCENGENEFPDFDYQTVYFANQYGDVYKRQLLIRHMPTLIMVILLHGMML